MSEAPEGVAASEPTIVERLARFMHDYADEHGLLDQPRLSAFQELGEAVLTEFFHVDVTATSIYAMPGVDRETLEPRASIHWGTMSGHLSPDELNAIGAAFMEVAASSELDSIMVRWLLRDPAASKENAVRILAAFREFRAEIEATR